MNGGLCETCEFWFFDAKKDEGFQREGVCRRRAPVAIPSELVDGAGDGIEGKQGLTAAWPRTFEEDFCGDHVLRREHDRYEGRRTALEQIDDEKRQVDWLKGEVKHLRATAKDSESA